MVKLSHHPDFYEWIKTHTKCGCGADRSKIDYVPDNVIGVDVQEPCCIHDHRYEIGGTEEDKELADTELMNNIVFKVNAYINTKIDCTNLPWWKCAYAKTKHALYPSWSARHIAMIYYNMVMSFGKKSFNLHEEVQAV